MILQTKTGRNVVIDEARKTGSGRRGTVYSLKELGSAGRGRIVPITAKVFAPRYRTENRKGKVKRLIEIGRLCPAKCAWPLALLFEGGKWAGYIMPYIEGDLIDRAIDDDSISISDRLEICAQVCEIVRRLHRERIVMGDLSTRNFLYRRIDSDNGSEIEVHAIDLDSAQVIRDDRAVFAITESKERSPEMPNELGKTLLTSKSDDYLAAVLTFKMLFKIDPRDEFCPDSLPVEIREKNTRNRVFAYKRRSDGYSIDRYGTRLGQLFNKTFEEGPYEDIPSCRAYEQALRAAKLALM